MGTSKSNIGPVGNTPLLPPWAPDPPKDEPDNSADDNQQGEAGNESKENKSKQATANLAPARGAVTRYLKNRNRQNFNKAARSYVKSYGGSKRASSTAVSGKISGARFSGFLSNVARGGIQNTLINYGLADCLGKSADYVLTKIADLIAPSGATNEEAAAREAIIDALSFIHDRFDLLDKDISELDSLDKQDFELVIKEYVSAYIFNRWLHEIGLKFEEKTASSHELIKVEKEVKEYIKEAVKLDLSDLDILRTDFNSGTGKAIIDNIFDDAYLFIEMI